MRRRRAQPGRETRQDDERTTRTHIPIGGSKGGELAMGMGASCRTLGETPVRAGGPIRQRAPIASSAPPMGMGACCSIVTRVTRGEDEEKKMVIMRRSE
eukprot:7300650-Pyramimonas_sp.AAC.1